MKVGIIGEGRVGSACALALVMRGVAREVVLVDRTRARAKAVATDIRYGAPLSESTDIRDGDYADLAGVAVAMITSGVNEARRRRRRSARGRALHPLLLGGACPGRPVSAGAPLRRPRRRGLWPHRSGPPGRVESAPAS